jgi:hypothetical protein
MRTKIKKGCGCQQFLAFNKAAKRIFTGKTQEEQGGDVWTTQGFPEEHEMPYLSFKL